LEKSTGGSAETGAVTMACIPPASCNGELWRSPVKESTKRIADWVALTILGLAAFLWFDYTGDIHPSSIWIVLLMLDIPFAVAAVIWLWGRLLTPLLREERTKRIVDWLALIPIGFLLSIILWGLIDRNGHPSGIWNVLIVSEVPLGFASIMWLIFRKAK
jgi:hypothetical protein